VREDTGLLVGLIPLMLERRRGFGRLLFVGTGLSDHLDILVREGREVEVEEAARRALQHIKGWYVADLQELRPGAAAWEVLGSWAGPRVSTWQSNCLLVNASSWDELLANMNMGHRSKARKTLRRAEADGVWCEMASSDVERAARRWMALHREYWRGRGINPEHLTERFRTHIETAARRLTASGLGGIFEFWRGGEVVASSFMVFGRDFVAGYLEGANEYAVRRFQVSSLYIWNEVNVARDRGAAYVSFLRGDEPYKLRWNPELVPNYRLILGRSIAHWGLYAGYHVLRSKAARYAKSENAPRWIQYLAARLKGYLPA
jgi:CelD/BcsL family acetyltransferase involved in cellulose biosynthesis